MRYLRFPKVLHDGEVHSIDMNKDSTKLLTSGKDELVHLWNVNEFVELVDQLTKDNESGNEMNGLNSINPIATFSQHKNLVNIVKWSPIDENKFVSSDIDGVIYMNNSENHESKLIYSSKQIESQTRAIDITWSKDGRLIAWSTSDGKINIFDTLRFTYQELTTLIDVDITVVQRSLAFDPTNNFLISLGDDTIIYLYQYAYDASNSNYQFVLLSKISKLMNKSSFNVKYKRISWSPDGEFVSVPTAGKNSTSLISLISRSNEWQNKVSLVGHDYNCEVIKFNPKIYKSKAKDLEIFNIIATAGSDKTIVIWNSTKNAPIAILKDVTEKQVVDLSWNNLGNFLIAASLDGYLILIKFEQEEIGVEVSEDIYLQLSGLEQDYIKPLNHKAENQHSITKKGASSIHAELLDQKDALLANQLGKHLNVPIEENPTNKKSELNSANDFLKESSTKSGDIVPEILSPVKSNSNANDILHSAMNNRQSKKTSKVLKFKPPVTQSLEKQNITTKNGKKRVQPILISNNGANEVNKPNEINPKNSGDVIPGSSKSLMEFDKPSYSVSEEFQKQTKRSKSDENGSLKKSKRELEPTKFIGSAIQNPNTTFAKIRLSVPKIRFNFQIASEKENGNETILDVRNGSGNETKPSRLTCIKNEKQLWTDFLPRFIQLVTEGSKFWAVSTAEGQILTYSHVSGKRLLPPMVLGSPLSFLESYGNFLMAVTSLGELYVWNVLERKIQLMTSLSPLLDLFHKFHEDGLSKSDSITMCSITSKGIPLVTLANGSGYLYNKDLRIWQTITESWWAFGSHYWDANSTKSAKSQVISMFNDESSIIDHIEQKTNEEIIRKTRTGRGKFFNKISKNMIMKEGFENLENTISLSHLENRILCCELLEEKNDFKKYFITYVQRVCELGLKAKLFEICSQLLDVSESKGNNSGAKLEREICGIDKHSLLKEIILLCASFRDAQRILVHFSKKLGMFDDNE